jgi:hypothetical protein
MTSLQKINISIVFLSLAFPGCGMKQVTFSDLTEISNTLWTDIKVWWLDMCQPVVARVEGRRITTSDLVEAYRRCPEPKPVWLKEPGARAQLLEFAINQKVGVVAAQKAGITRSELYLRKLAYTKEDMLVWLFQEHLKKMEPVVESEIRAFRENVSKEQLYFLVTHLDFKKQQDADKARKMLVAGKAVESVAATMPVDLISTKQVRSFSKGPGANEVEKVYAKLRPGEISGIIKISMGYELIQRHKGTASSSAELSLEDIKRNISSSKVHRKIEDLKSSYKVVIASSVLESSQFLPRQ